MSFSTNKDGKNKAFNEINITPLTDIFLVLLIIMMLFMDGRVMMKKMISLTNVSLLVNSEKM